MSEPQTFAAAINCMDGRTQTPVFNWTRERFGVDFVDMITEAGPVAALAAGENEQSASIRWRLEISVKGHGSRGVAIAAHHGCAGNPVGKERQLEQLAAAAGTVRSWHMEIECVTLWVDVNQEVHPIT